MGAQTISKTKSNSAFMVLSALGILFVVDCHSADGIGMLTSIFPYGSFFMPMFVFISGYFWKEKNVESWRSVATYLLGKFRKLMVPYLLWSVFYGFLVLILNKAGMNFPYPTIRNFVYSVFTDGTTFSINGAAWFVPTLFAVTAAYTTIRKMIGRIWSDRLAMAAFILLGAFAVALTKHPGGINYRGLLLYKTAFFIQFFQMGLFFKRYLENWFDRVNGLGLCISLVVLNLFFQARYENLDLGVLSIMEGFYAGNCLLPLLTSVTGIFFWLKVAKCFEGILCDSKLVHYISEHTFFIMMHHVLFLLVFNSILFAGMELGIPGLAGFDSVAFRSDPWYRFLPHEWVGAAYFMFSATATVLSSQLFDRLVLRVKKLR